MQVCAAPPFAADHTLPWDTQWRAHDLLRLRHLPQCRDEPAWVREAFGRTPYAVVRRAPGAEGVVAIGLRGTERSQRYGTWAYAADVEAVTTPEALSQRLPAAARGTLPAFRILAALQRDAAGVLAGLVWGPTGSTGFELATQVPTVTSSSDLDLLIRVPERLPYDAARQILDHLEALAQHAGVRVDAQLETPAGGVALAEWAAGKTRVMARHATGPQRVVNPWASAHGDA